MDRIDLKWYTLSMFSLFCAHTVKGIGLTKNEIAHLHNILCEPFWTYLAVFGQRCITKNSAQE